MANSNASVWKSRIVGHDRVNPCTLLANPRNHRTHPKKQKAIVQASIEEIGFVKSVIVNRTTGLIVDGHERVEQALANGSEIDVEFVDLTEDEEKKALLILDASSELATVDALDLSCLIDACQFTMEPLDDFALELGSVNLTTVPDGNGHSDDVTASQRILDEPFTLEPSSLLNAREGWWQTRKRAWLAIGIRSECGRGRSGESMSEEEKKQETGGLLMKSWTGHPDFYKQKSEVEGRLGRKLSTADFQQNYFIPPTDVLSSGTSVFDPVLCEALYRWFCPPGGGVLDPFAGGSVRGIVAAKLGMRYVGCDLRSEQIEANQSQWQELKCKSQLSTVIPSFAEDATPDLTSVENIEGVFFKRDDEFCIGGGRGGKVRSCWGLAQGATGLVTAGSRSSPQVNIVAQIARKLGIPCRVHCPEGELSSEVLMARDAGAEIVQHKAGYNNVIIARAREDAKANNWREIPFGMECPEAVSATASQVANIPATADRIVIPVGSGMSLAGLLHGLKKSGRNIPVLGVCVGADPVKRLDKYAPKDWRSMVTLVRSELDYHDSAKVTEFHGVRLDPIYEAKCIPYIREGDLLWVVGLRASESPKPKAIDPRWIASDSLRIDSVCADVSADMVFSCPPYADLEVYSDDAADLSNMSYCDFVTAYREIIRKSCDRLKPNRFAVFVVGEVRNKDGVYYNFVGDTIRAFTDAGLRLCGEAVLITSVGSLPIRIGRQFATTRKFGKTHQNVLVFVKGDESEARSAVNQK